MAVNNRRQRRKRRFWVRPGRTAVEWQNFLGNIVIPEEWRENFRMSKKNFRKLCDESCPDRSRVNACKFLGSIPRVNRVYISVHIRFDLDLFFSPYLIQHFLSFFDTFKILFQIQTRMLWPTIDQIAKTICQNLS